MNSGDFIRFLNEYVEKKTLNESMYVRHNQNPFDKKISDCAIRAVSQATDIPYEKICEMFGKKFKDGVGLDGDGVGIQEFDGFGKKTKLYERVDIDKPFLYYAYKNEQYEPTKDWPLLRDFVKETKGGRYLLTLRQNGVELNDKTRFLFQVTLHVVFADCSIGKYYDTMKNDPGELTVYGIYRINENVV